MIIIDLIQGSKEWHNFRRLHIGASDASSIMGLNPWVTPQQLWEEKVFGWQREMNDKMRLGQLMEEEARLCYELLSGKSVSPLVAESSVYKFISASLDGITQDRKHAVEIKCGKSSHSLAKKEIIPPYYISQLQHQMYVFELEKMDYFSYSKKDQYIIEVNRDQKFIDEMIEKEKEFWHNVSNIKPIEVKNVFN